MLLTVGQLKKILKDIPDDALFGSMDFANNNEIRLFAVKRYLLLQEKEDYYFVMNNMGTHWDERWGNKGNVKLVVSFDKDTGEKTDIKQY